VSELRRPVHQSDIRRGVPAPMVHGITKIARSGLMIANLHERGIIA
jgi:hypothetical protein